MTNRATNLAIFAAVVVFVVGANYAEKHISERAERERAERLLADAASREAAERDRRAALTPEQRAAEDEQAAKVEKARERMRLAAEKKKRDESARRSEVIGWSLGIRQGMRDPASLTWRKVLSNEDGSVLCMEFAARNGFGGMNVEHVLIRKGRSSQDAGQWNKHCAGKQFPHDMTDLAEYTARNPIR